MSLTLGARLRWVPGDDDPICYDCQEPLGRHSEGWERRFRDRPKGGYMETRTELVCPECCQKEDNGP